MKMQQQLESKLKCFHCSLEIKDKPIINVIKNEQQKFCCLGCSVACELLSYEDENKDEKLEKLVKEKINKEINKHNDLEVSDTKSFAIKGMTCVSCSPIIEKIINIQDGVKEAKVNVVSERIRISYDNRYFDINKASEELKKFGYTLVQKRKDEDSEYLSENYLLRLGLTWFLSMNIMAFSFGVYYGQLENYTNILWWVIYIELFLSTLIIFGLGYPFLKSAYLKLLKFEFSMETLVSFGSLTAYFYSVWTMLKGNTDVYYDTASMIVSFVLLGKFLENSSKSRASQAVKKLLKLGAKNATILKNNIEEIIEIDKLQIDDLVVVKAGEKIPADGIIIEGETSIDESMLTGESIPIDKKENSNVFAATINQEGRFVFKATGVGDDTALAKIVELIEKSQEEKTETQKLADKLSAWFIPIVFILAFVTFFIWYLAGVPINTVILNTTAVLVIACPCALGLATPMTTFVAIDKSASLGMIIKNPSHIEALNKINTIVIDKTGTLTYGKMFVKNIQIKSNKYNENSILEFVGSLENYSEHVIAKSIVNHVKNLGIELKEVKNFKLSKGLGVEGIVDNLNIKIGSTKYLNTNFEDSINTKMLQDKALTNIFVSIENEIVAIIELEDQIKPNVKDTIQKLQERNIEVIMLTGDNNNSAQNVANATGINKFYSNQLPQDKLDFITKLQNEGKKVMMIGDGINDAPSLVKSDIGLAISNATDISTEASDIAMINSDFEVLVKLFNIGKEASKSLKINLFWAFSYNFIGIPLAMAGFLKPIIAAALMAISSLLIVSNSLRLRNKIN